MKRIFDLSWVALVGMFWALGAQGGFGPLGDEDPFPLSCFNFTGVWVADNMDSYVMDQLHCSKLTLLAVNSSGQTLFKNTIVPDNKVRKVKGSDWTGTARHRWLGRNYGATIESVREVRQGSSLIQEVVQIESVSPGMMLESVYRKIQPTNGEAFFENGQRVFRRAKTPEDEKLQRR